MENVALNMMHICVDTYIIHYQVISCDIIPYVHRTSHPHFKIKKYLCYTRISYAILEIIHPHYFWQFEITEEERTKMR